MALLQLALQHLSDAGYVSSVLGNINHVTITLNWMTATPALQVPLVLYVERDVCPSSSLGWQLVQKLSSPF